MSTSAIATQLKPCPIYIDGRPQISRGEVLIQHNPATGEPVAEIPICTHEEVSAAIASAQAAFPAWSATPVMNRCRVLFHFHQLMEKHSLPLIFP
ncbi:MAG: hypothetical protein DMG63_00535 [Acidobacteria bacterium]|nr:MAG: hypothetical protein DMG63_00535 [Acidobacteriota bacterium]